MHMHAFHVCSLGYVAVDAGVAVGAVGHGNKGSRRSQAVDSIPKRQRSVISVLQGSLPHTSFPSV